MPRFHISNIVEISVPVFVRELSPLESQLNPVSASLKQVDGNLDNTVSQSS